MTQGGGWSENTADLKSDSAQRGQEMMMNTGGCGGTALAVGVLCHSWHFTQRINTKRVEIWEQGTFTGREMMSSVTMLVVCPYQWCTCSVSFAVRAERKPRVLGRSLQ